MTFLLIVGAAVVALLFAYLAFALLFRKAVMTSNAVLQLCLFLVLSNT